MRSLAFVLALAALAGDEEPLIVRDGVEVEPGAAYLLEGWIQAASGEARLEVEVAGASGAVAARAATPPVRAGSGWTYTAAEVTPAGLLPPARARILLRRGGGAEARGVQLVPLSPAIVANGGFESPLDGRGRVPLWSEEKDGALLSGTRQGSHRLDAAAREGQASLVVDATGDWHGVASVNYPVPPWSDRFEVSALARGAPRARARVLAVWSDDGAQRVLRVDASPPAGAGEWRRVSTGPIEPPPDARLLRAVLVAGRAPGPGPAGEGSAAVWFDDARIESLPPRERAVHVTVNQVGYEASGPKSVVVMTNFFPGETVAGELEVLDAAGRAVLRLPLSCAGRLRGEKGADWGWYFWRAGFSDLAAAGRYTVRASIGGVAGTSPPFAVAQDLLFRETAPLVVDFFFVQRCGGEVPGWHAACHLDGARLADGSHRDLAGGWHSAGDYNKITWEYGDGGAVFALARAAAAAPALLSRFDRDGDGLPDVLDEARWGAAYLAKLQTESGGFLRGVQQGPDRQAWMRWAPPEAQTDNVAGTADDPIVLEGDGHSPLAAGGWARVARLLGERGVENDHAERARRAWERSRASPAARSDPLLLLSALELWRATGDAALRAFALESASEIVSAIGPEAAAGPEGGTPGEAPSRLRGGYGDSGDIPAAALALVALEFPAEPVAERIRRALASHLDRTVAEAANPFGISKQKADREGEEGHFFEPSSAYGQNFLFGCRAWSALCIYRLLGDRRALAYAADHLDFVLGKNPYGLCMFEGKGTFNPPRYHHRYNTIPGRERGAVPGAIPNGFVRDSGGHDRPGFDLSTRGRSYPSYRTGEPWLVHDVFFLLAVTALREAVVGSGDDAAGEERAARFDADPGWDGRNHRSTVFEPRPVRQDFGYSRTAHAGGAAGEIGGFITPDGEAAYYARVIPRKTFADRLAASGTLACRGREFHVLIGFFNSRAVNEWRTPNTVALRLLGRGDVFYAFVEYATSRWRAGGDSPGGFATVRDPETGRDRLRGFPTAGAVHAWSLEYDPTANGGGGAVVVKLDGETAVCNLDPGHQADGAEFDRFGLLNVVKSVDGGGEVWLDDVTVLGETERFDTDPGWEGRGNRREHVSANVRPRFDFGWSPTRHAGGAAAGEIGGLVFRGDCRHAEKIAYYGDRLDELTLERPLRAAGKVCLRRGVSDSTTLFGFFHSAASSTVNPSQSSGVPRSFLGVSVGGPSAEGFYFEPAYNVGGGSGGTPATRPPYILPDGAAHDWTLEYSPAAAAGRGRITVTLDGEAVSLDLGEGERASGARFDRFGIVTTWIDGNAQEIFFDDLRYTVRQVTVHGGRG